MSEATIAAGIKAALQAMSEFDDVDVVEMEYGILDQTTLAAPYVIIGASDDFLSAQDAPSAETTWDLPVTLVEAFSDWETTLGNIRTRRQALIDKINSGDVRSAGGLEAVSIDEVRSGGPLQPVYGNWIDPELEPETDPIYIMAPMILVCEEF